MNRRIHIDELSSYIENNNFLVVGSPKGVGFSTYIAEWIAYKMFFLDDFSALILTDSRKDKVSLSFKIQKAFEYYGYPVELEQDTGKYILYLNGHNCGVCVINYDEFNLDTILDKQDVIIIDKDDCSNYLYEHIPRFQKFSDKVIFNTYDLAHSLYYHMDFPKVIVSSKYSKNYIRQNFGKYPNRINYDRVLLGDFTDY